MTTASRTKKESAPQVGALSKAERAKLAADLHAAEAQRRDLPETSARDRLHAEAMRERDHLDGCPGIVPGATRVELYPQTIPQTAQREEWGGPGDTCTTVRCIECGGFRLLAGTPDDNIRRLLELEPEDDADLDATL